MIAAKKGSALIQEVHQTEVPYGTLAIWFLGQESVIVKGDDVTIYIDPYVSDFLDRNGPVRSYPAPICPKDITQADLCLITHEHVDHMDEGTITVFHAQNGSAPLIAPACCHQDLRRMGVSDSSILTADVSEPIELFSKLKITVIPAAHEQLEQDDRGHYRSVGYVLELNGVTLYHAGDTVIYPGLTERIAEISPDVAMLPINGGDYYRREEGIVGNMNYREAAELAVRSKSETVIPLHYDVFAGNSEKPGYFLDYLYERYPEQKCHIMARGERFVYVSPRAFVQQSS
ncbi:MBL fold metallo-hydrolase [Paenibacillus lutimineralis]|uniref:MBL fold metallo-hydrolase n=1 Tax=Paenibacillus lutimineralis TaxID=2707005 RepID=A0A3Q9I5S8_9BACL|nr:MBL fold metallo-hydrolase [Paenibacillus lutimineralis]AZS13311.1 MBL fold metallo-hydrolase [Paenibacillus lutimineralis]